MAEGWEIWSEGYRATGQSGKHMQHGVAQGSTFKEACINLSKTDSEFRMNFNPDTMTFWGCKLFDNATDASKAFG